MSVLNNFPTILPKRGRYTKGSLNRWIRSTIKLSYPRSSDKSRWLWSNVKLSNQACNNCRWQESSRRSSLARAAQSEPNPAQVRHLRSRGSGRPLWWNWFVVSLWWQIATNHRAHYLMGRGCISRASFQKRISRFCMNCLKNIKGPTLAWQIVSPTQLEPENVDPCLWVPSSYQKHSDNVFWDCLS